MKFFTRLSFLFLTTLVLNNVSAQFLTMPEASQYSQITQRIGITDVTITYNSPQVKGRDIWGNLVPFGEIWRAGANSNTLIEFTHDVKIESKSIPAGKYGLHIIPTENSSTVIFSKSTTAWGSYTYDQAEDALRVDVKQQTIPNREWLTFEFNDKGGDYAVASLAWGTWSIPFKIEVAVHDIVLANFKDELRSQFYFDWQTWHEAAQYCLANEVALKQGLEWVNFSIKGMFSSQTNFDNLSTKAGLLSKLGKASEAAKIRKEAVAHPTADATKLYGLGRQLIGNKNIDEAFDIFKISKERFPDHWLSDHGLARAYSAKGNFKKAIEHEKVGLKRAPDGSKKFLESYMVKLEKGEDFN